MVLSQKDTLLNISKDVKEIIDLDQNEISPAANKNIAASGAGHFRLQLTMSRIKCQRKNKTKEVVKTI